MYKMLIYSSEYDPVEKRAFGYIFEFIRDKQVIHYSRFRYNSLQNTNIQN